MSISELRTLLETLREFGVTYYKCGDLEIGLETAEEQAEPTNAIGFAAPTDPEPAPDPLAAIRSRLAPEYFDPRLGLVASTK